MATCLLCLSPVRRRWWQWLLQPLPVHMGRESASCHAWLDAHARRVRLP